MATHPSPATHAMTRAAVASRQPAAKPKTTEQEPPPARFSSIFANTGNLLKELEDTPDTLVNEVSIDYDLQIFQY